jgi:tripartite-type tricarboxylate transporter receptor subunit TctC
MHSLISVENKPGAGATIATTLVAKAPADSHTLLFVTSGHARSNALYPKLASDPLTSFATIVEVGSTAVVVVVPSGTPYRTLTDLIEAARKQPGKPNFAAGGGGATVTALAAEYLEADAKIEMQGITYKGSGPALIALIGNEIDVASHLTSKLLSCDPGQGKDRVERQRDYLRF